MLQRIDVKNTAWPRKHGQPLFDAVVWWLSSLRWPSTEDRMATFNVTLLEMVVDFEVSTGIDVPLGEQSKNVPYFMPKVRSFSSLMQIVEKMAKPHAVIQGEWKLAKSLYPMIGNIPYRGLTRRPVFVGGKVTEAVIRASTERLVLAEEQPNQRPRARFDWHEKAIPHDEVNRRVASQPYRDWLRQRLPAAVAQ